MQAISTNLRRNLYGLANLDLPLLEFHSSAYFLKGKQSSRKSRANAQSPRTPARKRLAPTLEPKGVSGSLEVYGRTKSRDDKFPHQAEQGEKIPLRGSGRVGETRPRNSERDGIPLQTTSELSPGSKAGPSSGGSAGFEREAAPHVGRTSFAKPKSPPPFGRSWRSSRNSTFDRRGWRSFGLKEGAVSSRQKESFYSKGSPYEDRLSSDSYEGRQSFNERLSKESGLPHQRGGYNSQDRRPAHLQPYKTGLPAEFDTTQRVSLKSLPEHFTSPPLLPGLLRSVYDVLGPDAKPSPIQSLSLKHLFDPPSHPLLTPTWRQYLLASETGSGKSLAYLLPMIQYLKLTEDSPATPTITSAANTGRPLPLNPRALILAPTHELSRQLSSFAKSFLHNVRLRVLCASRANTLSSSRGRSGTASQLKRELEKTDFGVTDGAQFNKQSRPVDVLVGTPTKILEMVKGWGWDKEGKIEEEWDDARKERARSWIPGPPEAGLKGVEWVVVDEADILFDRDFQESTLMLLEDIARARGYGHASTLTSKQAVADLPISGAPPSKPLVYPFHLLLTSATIPTSLADYLTANHPKLIRLASPNLHQLPSTLRTEHRAWTSGNKNSDIERRIRQVWTEDGSTRSKAKSKILIFCNKSSKAEDLGLYLTETGIPNVVLTSTAQARFHGSNRHLAGFLKPLEKVSSTPSRSAQAGTQSPTSASPSEPNVMITTSLLSRGLDFSAEIKHVFIVDEPRNMIDFLHRAGRTGRAGHEGKVVVFGKMKGRGSGNAIEVKRKIAALAR